jgi:hypothetical protein
MNRRQASTGAIQPTAVIGLIVVLVIVGFVLMPALTIFDLPFFQVQASIDPRATIDGSTVHVTASTDLPDGAIVVCYLSNEDGALGDSTNATVAGGAFAFDTPLPWTSGSVELDCHFGTAWATQPPNVIDRFGSNGERMAGPQVFRAQLGTPKELFASDEIGPIGSPSSEPTEPAGSSSAASPSSQP